MPKKVEKVIAEKRAGFFEEKTPETPRKKRHVLLPLALAVLGVSVLAAVFAYIKYQESTQQAPTQAGGGLEVERIVNEISTVVELPQGETPSLATVSDASLLSEQPFFKNAKNGDVVLFYNESKKAILYRPTTKKVIDITTINTEGDSQPSATPSAAVENIKIVILNGTQEAGLTRKARELLEGDSIEVVSTGNTKEDYQTTSISSVSTSVSLPDSQLREIVKGITQVTPRITALPAGEDKPSNADAVLILGEDFAEKY